MTDDTAGRLKTYLYAVLLNCFLFPHIFGQQNGVGERLRLEVDYARFFGNDTLTYVEMYYAVRENAITYRPAEGKFVGGVNLTAAIKKEGKIIQQQQWTSPAVVRDSSQFAAGHNMVGVTSFALSSGTYECEVGASDFYDPTRSDTVVFPLVVQHFPTSRVSLSDIEVCSSIRRSEPDTNNAFYKNTLEVIPNVSTVFGEAVPVLFYYVEAYNLSLLPTDYYKVRASVYDAAGKEMFRQDTRKRRAGNSSVEVGTIKVHQLRGGTYTVVFELIDSVSNMAFSSSKKFFMFKPGEPPNYAVTETQQGVLESEFAVMTEAELDADFAPAKYFAGEDQIREFGAFSRLTEEKARVEAKRAFLYNFWKKQETAGLGWMNTTDRREYLKRVEIANRRFSGGYRKGWQTDRGRVYILYGEPSEVDRYPNSPDNNPYEVWKYHQEQGGVIFVFVDRTGFGEWQLIHSSHRNEMSDPNWQNQVKK